MNTFPLQWSVDTKDVPRGAPKRMSYEAGTKELEALKQYAGIDDLSRFHTEFEALALSGGRFRVSGTFSADLTQASVVNLEPVPSRIEENFAVEYWPEEALEGGEPENWPLDKDLPEPIREGRIQIGAFLSELFVLALDPYPKNDGDSFDWQPEEPQEEANPFAVLSRLKPEGSGG
jgi:uncharacterized metal-binding protein YceD (DUF177 family)